MSLVRYHLRVKDMEKEKEKLVEILKRAKKNKIELKKLKIPKAYQKHFKISLRWKFLIIVGVLSIIYGKFSHLFGSEKVGGIT